jgi:hypothetical protein
VVGRGGGRYKVNYKLDSFATKQNKCLKRVRTLLELKHQTRIGLNVHVMKLFSSSLSKRQNKLECFTLRLIFVEANAAL